MNALTATRLLRVAENASTSTEQVAVLGRDIRTSPERIARYCVTRHEPVYEDLATLVESMAFWDRRGCAEANERLDARVVASSACV